MPTKNLAVLVSPSASEVEQFAASELCSYLQKLFGATISPTETLPASAEAVFLLGSSDSDPGLKQAHPDLTEQGIVLQSAEYQGIPALIVGGGSPRATLWAVYELVERWGVRYLMGGDVLPAAKDGLDLPDLDVVMEPAFTVRAHPSIQDFVNSGESWGMADFKILIDQLAKHKFTRINAYAFGWQPFLDWECKGIKRSTSWLWYDDHFPITDDMIGRELFDDRAEFWNPDLPVRNEPYAETAAAGERLLHGIIEYARKRGMESSLCADLTQFTPEFAPLLDSSQVVNQVGRLTIVPGPDTELHNQNYFDLASACLQAALNTYPEAEYMMVPMPEWRQWIGVYEEAWEVLDAKYKLSEVISLEDLLDAAAHRKWGRGEGEYGVEKARNEIKGDLALMYFYDRLLYSPETVGATKNPNVKFMYHSIAEEIFPLLDRLLPAGSELGTIVDNFPTKILERREVLEQIPSRAIRAVMDLTIDDDNVGIMPQLSTHILHELMGDLRKNGWAGFVARERYPGDHDSCLAYLARAAWDETATPESVISDQIAAICGPDCVDDMLLVFQEVEASAADFERDDWDFAFPLPGMVMQYWDGRCFYGEELIDGGRDLPHLEGIAQRYETGIAAAKRAYENAKKKTDGDQKAALEYPGFWIGRLQFSLDYVRAVQLMRAGGKAEILGDKATALARGEEAMVFMKSALAAYASVARNPTDVGTIALINEHGYRALKSKLEELRA